jgi:hypothetical protein
MNIATKFETGKVRPQAARAESAGRDRLAE